MSNRRGAGAIAVAIAVLVVANFGANRLLVSWATVPWNVAVAVLLIAIARRAGISYAGIGIDRSSLRRGWEVGRWFVPATVILYSIGLAIPATRKLFEDGRVESLGWIEVGYHAFVAVPLGTVLLEEVAFRGVLPAMFATRLTPLRSNLLASLLFGSWHVLPAWEIYRVNPALRDVLQGPAGHVVGVAVGVVSTAIIGMFWCWLRYRTSSLLTTAIAHVATNSLGYAFAYLAWSLR